MVFVLHQGRTLQGDLRLQFFFRHLSRPIYPTFAAASLAAGLWTVVLVGRALPWQASRIWWVVFLCTFALFGLWYRSLLREVLAFSRKPGDWAIAVSLGAGPFSVLALMVLVLAYSSDQFNTFLESPIWRIQIVIGLAALTLAARPLQLGAKIWLSSTGGVGKAILWSLQRHSGPIILGSLVGIGILQATASVTPLGDDIWHYTKVTDALLVGLPYPNQLAGENANLVGMGAYYPALPFFPILIAISFAVFGHSLATIALPTVVAVAIWPLAMFAACRSLAVGTLVSYVATVLVFLFPLYQIHVLGAPEPDTVFIVLLLFAVALAGKANSSRDVRWWIGMGIVMALASLTRHEGNAYAAVIFLCFLAFYWRRRNYWMAALSFALVLLPFMVVYHSISGSWWPSTFGAKALHWQNVDANVRAVLLQSLPWYSQAIGLQSNVVVTLLMVLCLVTAAGLLLILRRNPPLVGIPLAGLGNVIAVFFMHPVLVYSSFPPDFLRHVSYGLSLAVLAPTCAAAWAFGAVSKVANRSRVLVFVLIVTVTTAGIYYDIERLARPEWWFGGKWSLLWTGSSYLFTDVVRYSDSLSTEQSPRSASDMNWELIRPLAPLDLRRVNRGEPYHWSSFLLALLGLTFAAAAGWKVNSKDAKAGEVDHERSG